MHSVFVSTFLTFATVMIIVQLLGRGIIAQRKRSAATVPTAPRQQRSAD